MERWRLYKKLYFAFKYLKGLFSQIVTIHANNTTLRENEQESVCFVFVLFGCCEVSWNQNSSGWKRPHSSLHPTALPWCRAVAGGGSEGKCSHSSSGHPVLISVDHKCPLFCCHVQDSQRAVPARMSVVTLVAVELRQQTVRSSS